jgi:hypothetical protein
VAGLLTPVGRPDCDQIATTSAGTPSATATTCDHNRLSQLVPAGQPGGEGPIGGRPRRLSAVRRIEVGWLTRVNGDCQLA